MGQQQQSTAAGLLLCAQQAGDTSRLLHSRRLAASAGECGHCYIFFIHGKLKTDLFVSVMQLVTRSSWWTLCPAASWFCL